MNKAKLIKNTNKVKVVQKFLNRHKCSTKKIIKYTNNEQGS